MNWNTILICASASIALAALFKYGFMFLLEWMILKFDKQVAERVIQNHGTYIADGIILTVAERITVGGNNNDNTQSVSFQETRRKNH